MTDANHIPVLLDEVLAWLDPRPGETALDGTLGLAGHARTVAAKLGPEGRLIGLDRDPAALERARAALSDVPCRVDCVHAAYSTLGEALASLNVPGAHRMLLDIGVSSLQLDTPERGFSFRDDGPLDMRMDTTRGAMATDLVNGLPEKELADLIYKFGEERASRRIAKTIVAQRAHEPIQSTGALASLIEASLGRRGRIHPATRTFQALRIAVNDELGELERGLAAAKAHLLPGGRLVVITFHSLEDRMVKQAFRAWAAEDDWTLPVRKVVKPTRTECEQNRRARSAKLRVIERNKEPSS